MVNKVFQNLKGEISVAFRIFFGWISALLFSLFLASSICHSLIAQGQPLSPLINSFETHQALKTTSKFGLEWISLGPTLNSARVESVQADPANPGTIYTAFGSGGLWKTTNNGMTWKSIFNDMPSLGIGDIALAPSDPNIIYVGTGESLKKARNFTMPGVGIYKSSDGGNTWTHLGLDDTWHIGEIAVHPTNPDIVVVAALGHFWSNNGHRGVFRSEDGGKTWSHVLTIDNDTGANDILFSPANSDVVYTSLWEHHPNLNGRKSGIYKSEDTGKTWQRVDKGIHIDSNTGRIGLAASYQDSDKVYAFVDQRNRGRKRGAGEVYKSINGGKSWQKTHDGALNSLSVIGWYFMDLYVNPLDDDEIYGLGVRLVHSTDGGKTFEYMGGQVNHLTPSPAQTLHLDHCEMWINPHNPEELLLGNDGGLYHSYDNGNSWLHLNNLPTGEFYDIEIDNNEPYRIYGGTQDDATVYGTAKELNTMFNDTWKYLWIDAWSGGDGCITLVDPNDANTIYFSMQEGGARRMNLQADTSVSIRPRFPEEDSIDLNYNFITPYMISPHNSNRLYMAGNYMMQSDDRGDNWKIISQDLIQESNQTEKGIAAGAFAESHFEEGVLFMGTDRGAFWLSPNKGKDWINKSEGLPNNYIRNITPSKFKKERVYIQQTGLNYDDFGAYVYVSEDYGTTWTSIKGNLPDHPVNVIIEDPKLENLLYAGTYRGVYISTNRGKSWSYLGAQLPDVSIADIVIEPITQDIIIATHGRGIYKTNLKALYTMLQANVNSNYLFDPPILKRPQLRDTHDEIDEQSIAKIPFSYYLEEPQDILLNIKYQKDSLIWTRSLQGATGINEFRWDGMTKEVESDSPYFIHYKEYIQKGTYQLEMHHSKGILKKKLLIE